jgi:SAM-dependent methyltransferase
MIGDFQTLMAESYDLGNPPLNSELQFWTDRCREAAGNVLELGSGTGRLLIPLAQRGFPISGLDNSDAMLKICTQKLRAANLPLPPLYRLAMPTFQIDSRFQLIFLADGGLSLFTANSQIATLLSTAHAHLAPAGKFIFDAILYSQDPAEDFPNANDWHGDWYRIDDNTIITQRLFTKYDRTTHTWETTVIYEKFSHGKLIETEMNVRIGRLFSIAEILALLSQSPFRSFSVSDWNSTAPATPSSKLATFTCTI